MYEPSKNKIVDYYTSDDKRLDEYYIGYSELLGLDKQPFGLDQNGTLRFEEKNTGSRIWKDHEIQDLNQIWIKFHKGAYSMDEMMQFYRELGYSLSGYIEVWSGRFFAVKDAELFKKALEKLENLKNKEEVEQEILEMIFLAQMDSVEDEIIFKYRKQAKAIVDKNFGPDAWKEFVESIRKKH